MIMLLVSLFDSTPVIQDNMVCFETFDSFKFIMSIKSID